MPTIKNCKTHGSTEFVKHRDNRWRCKKCRSENVTRYRLRLKRSLIEAAGGSCSKCGYARCVEALHFHHHEKNKESGVAKLIIYSRKAAAEKEAKKCILLCANCHAEEHSKSLELESNQ